VPASSLADIDLDYFRRFFASRFEQDLEDRSGTSNIRNPILASFATRIIPYRGLGTGILRALKEYPAIDFVDDHDRNEFRAVISVRTPSPVNSA